MRPLLHSGEIDNIDNDLISFKEVKGFQFRYDIDYINKYNPKVGEYHIAQMCKEIIKL
jgi:hypothetical protein